MKKLVKKYSRGLVLNRELINAITLIFTLIIATSSNASGFVNPTVITVEYNARIILYNYQVAKDGETMTLTGVINGVLRAKFVFREENVFVTVNYVKYDITGFTNDSIEYILSLLRESKTYSYNVDEEPYSVKKIFYYEGGVKYYVSQRHLLNHYTDSIEQSIVAYVDQYSNLYEYRYFKYDYSTGILLKMNITSILKVNETTTSMYVFTLDLNNTSIENILLKTINYQYIALTLFTISLIASFTATRSLKSSTRNTNSHINVDFKTIPRGENIEF